MIRLQALDDLQSQKKIDVVIIGGGSTGLGTALDATTRGLSVVLFESHDVSSGTSSRSTKLLHGGVRYLAQGNIQLVKQAMVERQTIMKIAPHLAQPLAFVIPVYTWWQKIWFGAGLTIYNWLAGPFSLGKTHLLNKTDTQKILIGVKEKGLKGGVQFWDGQFDDARLAISIAKTAEKHGAKIFNYVDVESIVSGPDSGFLVTVKEKISNQKFHIKTDCVINSTGVWVDELIKKVRCKEKKEIFLKRMVTPSQGVHLVVDRSYLKGNQALLIPKTSDGRILFAIPWLGSVILGTTDTPRNDTPREPLAFRDEIEFILREASIVLKKPVKYSDVKSMWVGLRPLINDHNSSESTKNISREHRILIDSSNLITVTGGKWTTYRSTAEEVIDTAIKANLIYCSRPSQTRYTPLIDAPHDSIKCISLTQLPNIHLLGSDACFIEPESENNKLLGFGLTESMVRHFVQNEHALFVEDVLARRWRVLFLDAKLAAKMAASVAEIMKPLTGIDPKLEQFLKLCDQYQLDLMLDQLN